MAQIVLHDNPRKATILKKIRKITRMGMDGEIPFTQSLMRRLKLIPIRKTHIKVWVKKLKMDITDSILRNKWFFKKYRKQIYIISGSYMECILPVIKDFGIPRSHIFTNTFIVNKNGIVRGVDKKNPLAKEGGKAKILRNLNLNGNIIVLGDGHTDYQLCESGLAHTFIAFTENIKRKTVMKKADMVARNFEEFIQYINKKVPPVVQTAKGIMNFGLS